MAKTELGRGLKQAIVAKAFIDCGVKTFKKDPSAEVKEKIVKQAQTTLDKRKAGGSARQIANWLLRQVQNEDKDYSPTALAERLKAQRTASPVRKAKAKAKAKKTPQRKAPPASAEVQAAA